MLPDWTAIVLIVVVGADPEVVVPEFRETIPPEAEVVRPPPPIPSLSENIPGVGEGPDTPTSDIMGGVEEILSLSDEGSATLVSSHNWWHPSQCYELF